MTTIHFHEPTTATPEQFLAGLTDFGPDRSTQYLEVHHRGPDEADVTEGSSGVWERLHYDWSVAHRVVMTTTDSNVWGNRSARIYTLIPQSDGTTHVDLVAIREGKNVKGRLLAKVEKRRLGQDLQRTIKAVEARAAVVEHPTLAGAVGP